MVNMDNKPFEGHLVLKAGCSVDLLSGSIMGSYRVWYSFYMGILKGLTKSTEHPSSLRKFGTWGALGALGSLREL